AICSSGGSDTPFQIGYDLRLELGWDTDLYPQHRFRSHRMLLSSGDATSLESALELNRYEVGLAGELHQLRRELRRFPKEARRRTKVLHEVTRVARAQRDVPLEAVLRDPLRRLRIEGDPLVLADATEDLGEFLRRRRLDLDLVLDAPQERLIHQGRVRAVRREHEQHVERDLDLAAIGRRQEVDVAVERDDPAVEELIGRGALAAEVVDEENAAARLHLERRFVDL